MDPLTRLLMQGAAGAAGGDVLGVEDVFSTWLYTGNGSTQTITNGIDLDGEGGMVWIKIRTNVGSHALFDTVRGATKDIRSNSTNAESSNANYLTAFNSNGFSLGSDNLVNSGGDYASWTFRKAEKFFDVVTYTGNGSTQNIAHNLGSVPGFIIVKRTDSTSNWICWHRSLATPATQYLTLNLTNAAGGGIAPWPWNSTNPTSSQFSIGYSGSISPEFQVNINSATYVAYVFAHDAGGFGNSGDESVIKCGSFTGSNFTVDLGWEPQWLLTKRTDLTNDWSLVDNMRGFPPVGQDARNLRPNTNNDENTAPWSITSTGFTYTSSSASYIYIAIRRGPMKTPEDATEVFSAIAATASTGTTRTTGFPVDLQIGNDRSRVAIGGSFFSDRLRGVSTTSTAFGAILYSSSTAAESTTALTLGFDNTGFKDASFYSTYPMAWWNFRRAPGFFDVVAYNGNTSVVQNVSHSLGVVPELMIFKTRSGGINDWYVYNKDLGVTKYLNLNKNTSTTTSVNWLNNTAPTASVFSLGTYEANWQTYPHIAYLFATLPGISKVGSYTGTGTTLNIDCGFTAGARFVLIKRTDSTGDWYVWDTARGIVSGNDPHLRLNAATAEITNTDYIDPLASGFLITSSAPAAINASGGSFIFLAVA